jgi:hypothetical protein
MADELPSNFDWVTHRAQCSAPNMFDQLRELAQSNVETANQRGSPLNGSRFRFKDGEPSLRRGFTVWDVAQHDRRAVDFWLDGAHTIHVEPTHQNRRGSFTATLTLNDRGQCRFLVDSHELDQWQLLRRGLEWLFFDDAR